MRADEKLNIMISMLGESVDKKVLNAYLVEARAKVLNRCFPYKEITDDTSVPTRYEYLQIELAISLYNLRGVEGEQSHNENGVSRTYRSEVEILSEITPFVGLPL